MLQFPLLDTCTMLRYASHKLIHITNKNKVGLHSAQFLWIKLNFSETCFHIIKPKETSKLK